MIGLGLVVLFEPVAEVGIYTISTLVFVLLLLIVAIEIHRRRPRSAASLY